MVKLQKFLFDTDFGAGRISVAEAALAEMAEPEAEVVEEAPPPPTFSEEELALARDQAFQAGQAAGRADAEAATERMVAQALTAIGSQLPGLSAAQAEAADAMLREATGVALAVIRKLQPEFCRHHGLAEIEGIVHECLSHLDREMRITVRVHPSLLEAVRQGCAQAAEAASFEGKLIVTADPTIAAGDCRLEWGDGGAERNQARLWAEIDAVVGRALARPGDVQAEG
jgi:flagellar assembly protein FliH